MECQKDINSRECSCPKDCENKGLCCKCIKYHRDAGGLPFCLRK